LIDIHFSLEVVGVPGKSRLQDDSTVRLVYVRGTARIIVSKVEKIGGPGEQWARETTRRRPKAECHREASDFARGIRSDLLINDDTDDGIARRGT
jgi:hypothetical protein